MAKITILPGIVQQFDIPETSELEARITELETLVAQLIDAGVTPEPEDQPSPVDYFPEEFRGYFVKFGEVTADDKLLLEWPTGASRASIARLNDAGGTYANGDWGNRGFLNKVAENGKEAEFGYNINNVSISVRIDFDDVSNVRYASLVVQHVATGITHTWTETSGYRVIT